MNKKNRLAAIDGSTPAMSKALPDLPMRETVLIRLLRMCFFGMGDFLSTEFRRIGLNENSFHILCLLVASEGGQASPSELSELVGTSRANITRILGALLDEGLATRRTEELDGRRHMIQITNIGRQTALDAVPRLIGPLERAFAGLDAGEQSQLDALLRKSIRSFDDNSQPFGLISHREPPSPVVAGKENGVRKAKRKTR
jgi:MarR family transcriptional repressor of emrRAB